MTTAAIDAGVDWPPAGGEIPTRAFGPFEAASLARYATVSGDDNPLHLDAAAARAAGLQDVPVQGMLMLACFEPFLTAWRRDLFIARLSAKFLRPVLAGQSISLSGRVLRSQKEPEPQLILRLFARGQDKELAILGEAVAFRKLCGQNG